MSKFVTCFHSKKTDQAYVVQGEQAIHLDIAFLRDFAEYAAGAGLLIGEPDRAPGHVKSLFLLFGRIALTVLFLTVGISQVFIQPRWLTFKVYDLFGHALEITKSMAILVFASNPPSTLSLALEC